MRQEWTNTNPVDTAEQARADRVRAIRTLLETGRYHVPAALVAERMIALALAQKSACQTQPAPTSKTPTSKNDFPARSPNSTNA